MARSAAACTVVRRDQAPHAATGTHSSLVSNTREKIAERKRVRNLLRQSRAVMARLA